MKKSRVLVFYWTTPTSEVDIDIEPSNWQICNSALYDTLVDPRRRKSATKKVTG